MMGVNEDFGPMLNYGGGNGGTVTANNTQDPEQSTAGGFFDPATWRDTAQAMAMGLLAGKIKKQYDVDLSNHLPYTKDPNGNLVAMGGTAAYGAYDSGALAGGLRAAGFVQQNWPLLLGAGVVVAFLLLRK